ncbi:MAG TPA: radical SAM protein, partial [Candidatus Omnitrophota bacterium]|nr:radical SAM protein [Candidatus Omnitrophota bacterium]
STLLHPHVAVHVDILLQFVFAYTAVYRKYLVPMRLGRRRTPLPFQEVLTVTGLFVMNLALHYSLAFFTGADSFWGRAGSWGGVWLQLLTFIYISGCFLNGYPEIQEHFSRRKEIYLVAPTGGYGLIFNIFFLLFRPYPPIFIILQALTPKGYHFREFFQVIWQPRYYTAGKLVAIPCVTQTAPEVYHLARKFREQGSKVVLGGPHVAFFPEEALEYCDSIVIGEVEGVWKDVIRDYENGTLQKRYQGVPLENFAAELHRAMMSLPPEKTKSFLETSRGCKFDCDFCAIPAVSGRDVRKKPVAEVVELIRTCRPHARFLTFFDSNIYNDPVYFKELVLAMKPLKIKWKAFATIDIGANEEILRLAKESGCVMLGIGYEIPAGSRETEQGGKFSMSERYLLYTRRIKKAGIKIKANFTIGFEADTLNWKDLWHLWKFCFRLLPYNVGIGVLTPFPGSRLYARILRDNRMINLNWHQFTTTAMLFKHDHINNRVMDAAYPWLVMFFAFTASLSGLVALAVLVLILII